MKALIRRLMTRKQFVIIQVCRQSLVNDLFRSFEINDKLETGRYFTRSSASSLGFLRIGVIMDFFQAIYTSPEQSDLLSISFKNGLRSVAHSFNNHIGIGSRSHCLFGVSAIKWHSSFTDDPVKACRST